MMNLRLQNVTVMLMAMMLTGRCLGTFIGGKLLGKYGDVVVFQSAAVAAAICAVIYLSLHQFIKYKNSKKNIEPKPQPARENGNYLSNLY